MSFEKKGNIVLIGYARVSSNDQNLDLQIEALKKSVAPEFFQTNN